MNVSRCILLGSIALTIPALPESDRLHLIEEYKNELQFSDGDIFRYYRQAQKSHNERSMRQWESRLSESKLRNLLQIEKAHHGSIAEALDALLPLPGIWQDFHLGSFNRVLPMHVWQVINAQQLRSVTRLMWTVGDPCVS